MSSTEINILKRFFETKCIHVSIYWLECCLEWFKENNRTYTEAFMCKEVLGQWLEADLRDIEIPSLPKDISKHKKHVLNGNYALQILYVKDISRSSYSQLKNIRDMYKLTRAEVDKDTDFSGTGKRVLYVYMTDGLQNINGFEYQPVSSLNTNILPGTKILLVGPLFIRNGEILLKENNVKILGGQVEELLVCNAYENVLARELNMPENPTPGQIQTNNNEMNVYNIALNIVNNAPGQIQTNNNEMNVYNNIVNNPEVSQNIEPNVNNFYDDIDDNDDIFNNINLTEQFDENQSTNEPFQNNIEAIENTNQLEPNDDDDDLDDLENTMEVSEKLEELNTTNRNTLPICADAEPYIYIKYLLDNRDKIMNKTFKVRAHFFNVIEKLKVSKTEGWTMKFEIMDSTGIITVDFLSTVIEKLMDMSPSEALAENLKVKNKVSICHKKVSDALKNCKKQLNANEYIIHLHFKNLNKATIICLETVTEEHLNKLQNRVEHTQIKLIE